MSVPIVFNTGEAPPQTQLDWMRTLKRDGDITTAAETGTRFLNVLKEDGNKLSFVTPPVRVPYGANVEYEGKPQKPTLKLEIGADDQPFIDAMENVLLPALREVAVANAAELIRAPSRRTAGAISSDLSPIVHAPGTRMGPTITMKIAVDSKTPKSAYGDASKWWVRVQDKDGKKLTNKEKEILKKRNLRVIVKCEVKGVYANSNGIFARLTASYVRVLEEGEDGDGDGDAVWGGAAVVTAAAERKRRRVDNAEDDWAE